MRPPNVLVFMSDHQRADTVLPDHPAPMPNVRRLAAEGLTFTDAFCPSPHCCPSRATFHSGLYPSGHGVWNNICNDQALSRGPRPGVRLWSEDLAAAGYRMFYTGKWHVSVERSPAGHGWEEGTVTGRGGDFHGVPWRRYEELAAATDAPARGEGEMLRPGYGTARLYGERPAGAPPGADEKTLREALERLPALAAGRDPWCLFVGFTAPHDPYVVPRAFLDRVPTDRVALPASYADALADKPRLYRRLREQVFGQLSEREVREAIRHFRASCCEIDERFGRILAALDAGGAARDTVVLFCSDHGDYAGEHGLFAKGIPCFQGAYRVPFVVRWPAGLAAPGRRCDAFVSLADFAPTVLELAGIAPGRRFTGRSLVPFLRGETPPDWRDAIHTQCNGVELYYTQRSVMTRDAKYVFNGFDEDELYDLRRDPHEMRNLAADPAWAPVKRALCRRMWRFAREEGDGAINNYVTVGLAPWGPAEAFRAG